MLRRRVLAPLCALLVSTACGSPESSATQITVRVDADPAVALAMAELRVTVHPAKQGGSEPSGGAQTFHLSRGTASSDGDVNLPFSFGLRGGGARRILLVLEGYAELGALAEPVIERKVYAEFSAGKTLLLSVYLSTGCLDLEAPCDTDALTCAAEEGAEPGSGTCGKPETPTLMPFTPGSELPVLSVPQAAEQDAQASSTADAGTDAEEPADAGQDAAAKGDTDAAVVFDAAQESDVGVSSAPDAAPDAALPVACPASNTCVDPLYPCVNSSDGSYTCSGELSEWPVRGESLGKLGEPRFNLEAEVAVDLLTGLRWQRMPARPYSGCTGTVTGAGAGSACTWEQAKAYCAQLTLQGLPARLPSVIELQSLLDFRRPASEWALDPSAFPPAYALNVNWTRTLASEKPGGLAYAYYVDAKMRMSNAQTTDTAMGVRCVAGGTVPIGTPRDRYVVNHALGTVKDTRTGLEWLRDSVPVTVDWQAAQTACDPVGNGFRVPTFVERMSLVDPATKPPLIAPAFRTLNKMYVYSWTSTLSPRGSAYYVASYFIDASDADVHANVRASWGGNLETDFGYEVRCVR